MNKQELLERLERIADTSLYATNEDKDGHFIAYLENADGNRVAITSNSGQFGTVSYFDKLDGLNPVSGLQVCINKYYIHYDGNGNKFNPVAELMEKISGYEIVKAYKLKWYSDSWGWGYKRTEQEI